jgi:hypothetical protein
MSALGSCALAWSALACGSAHLPETSYVAPGSTPEPLRVEAVALGDQAAVRDRALHVLSDSLFHPSGIERSAVAGYSLRRFIKARIDVLPNGRNGEGRETSRVVVSGETYIGDDTRPDSIGALPERWRLVTASDAAATVLRSLARAVQVDAPSASDASPPALPRPDSATAALLTATPVGRTVVLCTPTVIPPGWLALYWFTDQTRCPPGPARAFPGEPNAMRVEREW